MIANEPERMYRARPLHAFGPKERYHFSEKCVDLVGVPYFTVPFGWDKVPRDELCLKCLDPSQNRL